MLLLADNTGKVSVRNGHVAVKVLPPPPLLVTEPLTATDCEVAPVDVMVTFPEYVFAESPDNNTT